MLSLPYYRQINDDTCGPACLQMVFEFYGKKIFQEELAARLLHPSENVWVPNSELVKVAEQEGFSTVAKNNGSFSEIESFLKCEIPVVVNYLEPGENEGHFAVVVGLDEKDIILNDPIHGEDFRLSREKFESRWYDHNKVDSHWLLAITPKGAAV